MVSQWLTFSKSLTYFFKAYLIIKHLGNENFENVKKTLSSRSKKLYVYEKHNYESITLLAQFLHCIQLHTDVYSFYL
ncbi:hypothetical protein TPENAI_60432 [Tenacibaculum litopenaei]